MLDTIASDNDPSDSPLHVRTDRSILVPRPVLEQLHAHLTSAYATYQTRRLRQAIMILEHILNIRP